jgi:solute carrier family 8 (sodium/calcium exchanger)
VVILNDDTIDSFSERVTDLLGFNHHKFLLSKDAWKEQITDAMFPPKGDDCTVYGAFMWFLLLPWSFFNCISPPTSFFNGWGTFVYALGCVGMTTALISDLANLFGCIVGLRSDVTAITFVALGTSLPDTFASRLATQQEARADAAITNVTGSNSVNVFLGLGLAWTISAVYWTTQGPNDLWKEKVPCDIQEKYPGGIFYVPAGALGFGVTIFSILSVLVFTVLHCQRRAGGELGGPYRWYVAGTFVMFWLIFVVISSLVSYEHFDPGF